jgi:ABC-2 type transport system permease protein
LRRNLAGARIAVLSQLEYRFNFTIDALVQPLLTSLIEYTIWAGILTGMGKTTLGGFGRESYLAYALWAVFVGRVTSNWMYEFNMLDDIYSGKVNSILVRPVSFYEFYLAQFLSYKVLVVAVSFLIPLGLCWAFHAPVIPSRIPFVILMLVYYLVFVHTISFTIASLAFFLNRAHSFTGIKNLAIWVLAGEMIPLDLYPEPLKTWLIHSPFASGVYIPTGYITGRIGTPLFLHSFISITLGILFLSLVARWLWTRGVRSYTGTGA